MREQNAQLTEKILKLKEERNAVILAHNYQIGEVQDIADYVGDSFGLSRVAADTDADVIVFCGVHFMAEGAAILAPEKTVLLPEILAGCPMADMVTADALREKKKEHPNATVVTYVNSSAAVKAESDVCVTSSNALNVVNSLDTEEILFVPDMNLGSFIADRTDKRMIMWEGYCITHHRVRAADVDAARERHPDAVVVVHPECRPEVVKKADHAFSTGGILKFARESEHKKLIIGTEMGLIHRLEKENPEKEFYLLHQGLVCPNMKYTNLEKVAAALENMQPVITVDDEVREGARRALERMLAVS
ncbi:quinolinate synthase NadA [Dethiobacter alkaliphilus]|uniref:Quinolinate synthase n=1 Tax=Dethiobacter alkaliphilus AHT 1 TaxID=555088 RepID=C0GKY7_DETAL|nr:quinolinate synthase NadA [Dethiobacter alkaliphilus]EEG75999.1 quinolinate synthetase complex, A subunit [Dethiobacter alkaliphilus AHT 1]